MLLVCMPCWTEAGSILAIVINASNSEVDVRAFGAFLGSLENETLRRTFVRIKKYLVAQDKVGPSSAVMNLPTLLVAERQPLLRLRSP